MVTIARGAMSLAVNPTTAVPHDYSPRCVEVVTATPKIRLAAQAHPAAARAASTAAATVVRHSRV